MMLKFIAIAISLSLFAVLELRWPFFRHRAGRWTSLAANLELAILNIIAVRYSTTWLFQQLWPASEPIGLFRGQQGMEVFAIAFLALDLYMYLWHRLMHSTAWGWRLHQVHHSDRHLTTTTAYRFHTLEVLISQLPKIALVCLLGIPLNYLLIYESIYAVELLFHHSNWALPKSWDHQLSWLIVTPHYHRNHHSEKYREQNSNYSSFLTLWDVIFRSHQYPQKPEQIQLGLGGKWRSLNLLMLLRLPFLLSQSVKKY